MKRVVHVTLWDVRSILPLAGLPRRIRWWRDGWDFARALEDALREQRACTGRVLERQNQRECFDGTADPTCPQCVHLWQTHLVMRDRRMEAAS